MSEPAITVRIATPADMSEIMALSVEAAKENGFLDASTALLAKAVWGPINQDHGIIGCIGEVGHLEGMVVLNIGKIFYSDTDCLEERTLYLRPEYRNASGGRANKLLEFSMKAAEALNLPLLIGVLSNQRTEAKCRLYTRKLGKPAGAYWIVHTKTGGHEVVA